MPVCGSDAVDIFVWQSCLRELCAGCKGRAPSLSRESPTLTVSKCIPAAFRSDVSIARAGLTAQLHALKNALCVSLQDTLMAAPLSQLVCFEMAHTHCTLIRHLQSIWSRHAYKVFDSISAWL